MFGLVPEKVHSQQGSDAASDDGQPYESLLGYALLVLSGLPLVHAVDDEGQDIDALFCILCCFSPCYFAVDHNVCDTVSTQAVCPVKASGHLPCGI